MYTTDPLCHLCFWPIAPILSRRADPETGELCHEYCLAMRDRADATLETEDSDNG